MNRTDLLVLFSVENANPNGDPMEENYPRTTLEEKGFITDVCLKRKTRNRLAEMGKEILNKSKENCGKDEKSSMHGRIAALLGESEKKLALDYDKIEKIKEAFIDVRAFGQVYADGNARHTRSAVTFSPAISYDPVEKVAVQITKSYSMESEDKKDSSTMGMKYFVKYGLYSFYANINGLLAEQNGLSDADVDDIINAIGSMFANDATCARPAGSMNIEKIIIVKHNNQNGQCSPKKVKGILHVEKKEGVASPVSYDDYNVTVDTIDGVEVIVIDNPWFDGEKLVSH